MQVSDDRERVRDASPIEEIIQDYLPLIPDGRNLKALCPFHAEKTPSFKVDPERGTYRCFGCDERGDVFSFVMKLENVEFRESLELLAERAGITLTAPSGGARATTDRNARQREYDLLVRASRWFQKELTAERGTAARRYLSSRGFTNETLDTFEVGFAPDGWSNLSQDMAKSGVPEEVSRAVGLVKQGQSGKTYDTFRHRVMFPIRTLRGRVVGFGGRVLPRPEPESADARQEAKYINSAESSVFQKGRLLYGLFEGREAIRRQRTLLVMEGYTDVMMAHQAGFQDAVATLGTALTEANAEQISRHANQVRLVFDGDEAGRRAARKAVSLFIDRELEVRVVLLPSGDDPCAMLSEPDGSRRFVEHVEKARGLLAFLLDELVAECGSETGEQKDRVARGFFAELARVSSEIRREEGLALLAERIAVPLSRVEAEFERRGQAPTRERATEPKRHALPGDEEALVLAAMAYPQRRGLLFALYPPSELQDDALRRIAHQLSRTRDTLDAMNVEDPVLKSRFLALAEILEHREEDDETAVRIVHELLCFRIDDALKETRRQLTAGGALDAATSRALLERMQEMKSWVRRLESGRDKNWEELLAVFELARGALSIGEESQ